MTLRVNSTYSRRCAIIVENTFSGTGLQVLMYSGTPPTESTINLVNTNPDHLDLSSYSGQLIVTFTATGLDTDGNNDLVFNPANYPLPTAATAAGTISWCAFVPFGNASNFGTIVGPVTLTGGNGLVFVNNGGEGGGSGLAVNVGDIISIVSFKMDWKI